ncbi:MAG: M23 family metallopeptidase [Pseudomonadota bacterium]
MNWLFGSGNGRLWAPFFVLAMLPASGPAQESFAIGLPLACTSEQGCYIRQLVDGDPRDGVVEDYTCGRLANDGHTGTDFALPTLAEMREGVTVRAVASGVVRGVRDGMPDISAIDPNAPDLAGRECGNGVVISHGDGWESQYCHLRKGSVAVASGAHLAEGDVLGLVGMSGEATFPHVHFTLRKDGKTIDPFNPDGSVCGGETPALWRTPPDHQEAGLVTIGFSNRVPSIEDVTSGIGSLETMRSGAPALILWAYAYEVQAGDELRLEINGPGLEIPPGEAVLDETRRWMLRFNGKRAPADGWPTGGYIGRAQLVRDGKLLSEQSVELEID